MSDRLEIRLSREPAVYAPGETVSGTLYWECERAPRKIYCELRWETEGKADFEGHIADQIEESAPESAGSLSFAFRLPHEPWSFRGKLVRVCWTVLAKSGKAETVLPLVSSPTGAEVVL